MDAEVELSDPRGVRISTEDEANPTNAVRFCKMLPAFGQPGSLWVTELFSTFQIWSPCEVLAKKLEKEKYTFLTWLFVEISAGLVPREAQRRKGVCEKHLTSDSCSTGCLTGDGTAENSDSFL